MLRYEYLSKTYLGGSMKELAVILAVVVVSVMLVIDIAIDSQNFKKGLEQHLISHTNK